MHVLLCRTASSDRYPRWGYLDKFAENHHMARAVVSMVLVHAVGLGAYALWNTSNVERHLQLETVTGSVLPQPLPVFEKAPSGESAGESVHHVAPAPEKRVTPVPVRDDDPMWTEAVDWRPGGHGVGHAGGVPGSGSADGESFEWNPQAPLPEPIDFVPFELAPELITMESPTYPEIARAAGVEGKVRVFVLVGVDGFVVEARMADDGVPMLNESALHAARTAVFKPALQSDQPVAVWIVIPIEFDLRR